MNDQDNKELIEALNKHSEALEQYNSLAMYSGSDKVLIDYTELLRNITNKLENIESKLPNKSVGKY
ncbi:hypothetical protein [Halobacillus seohaensis]|uniref:Uncharacterized protein n=1 Tax=Halobacillus seohaensis TaxID=447421 RepID=A0ABW2ENA3_9BACI